MSNTEFRLETDIANRALQHVGLPMLNPALGFTEDSNNALQTAFAYPKLRQAELQRNVWRFAIRKAVLRAIDADTVRIAPSLWMQSTTYFVGSLVSDERGVLYESRIPNNLGNAPQIDRLAWEPYFGPLSVARWLSTTGYSAGELVYVPIGPGTYRVYKALQSNNTDNPATTSTWDATVIYEQNDVVTHLSVTYMSRIDQNLNQTPAATSPLGWSALTTYAIGNTVTGSDGVIYTSLANGNLNNDPTFSPVFWTNTGVLAAWTTVFVGGATALKWRQIGGPEFPMGVGLSELNLVYPVATGPSIQASSRNVFLLPSGFLRRAPQDPRAGAVSYLGAPSGLPYDDWELENDVLVTSEIGPIMLRFVADVMDVTRMHAMFCEGLAARLALEVCEPLTQSASKLGAISKMYSTFMTEARMVNAVEIGAEEPPEDDWITCRG